MQIKIERISSKNLDEIYEISQEQFKEESWSLSQFKDCLHDSSYISFMLTADDKAASFLIAQDAIDSINLLLIATKDKFKNKGYSTLLINKLLELSKEKNVKTWLEVKSTNPAISLYKKLGFRVLYERKNYYKDGSSALILEKF